MKPSRALIEDTIVAVATPPGEGGIGVVRLSGTKAFEVADALFQSGSGARVSSQKGFTARYGRVVSENGAVVDEAVLLVMRAPKSYTGEDTVEISAHGGSAVLQAIVGLALGAGARLAQPGEFTKRAFLNGRIDLLQAEAVLDVIRAGTERSRGWAVSQLEGTLSKKMKEWKEELIGIASHLEASVDFPDDSPDTESLERTAERLLRLRGELERILKDSELVFLAKRGFSVALCGRPNVGKSSLLNRLTRSDRVIVTPYPGTTRDVVEEQATVAGIPVRFLDTAGMRDTEHPIEKEGVERSKKAMASADLVLLVLDSSQALDAKDKELVGELGEKPALVVLNKRDLPQKLDKDSLERALPKAWPVTDSSCVQEEGTQALEEAIASLLTQGVEVPEEALISTARQKDLLEKISKELSAAEKTCRQGLSPELVASDVRQALGYLGEMVGEVFNEDILETLFKQFCIGK